MIHRTGPWRHLEAVEFATLTWVDWFNTRRLLEPIGYVPPAEYEAQYEARRRHQPLATNAPATVDGNDHATRRVSAVVLRGMLQPASIDARGSWSLL